MQRPWGQGRGLGFFREEPEGRWDWDVHRPFIMVCGLSLVAVSRGYCLAAGRGLLAVAFLVSARKVEQSSLCSTVAVQKCAFLSGCPGMLLLLQA